MSARDRRAARRQREAARRQQAAEQRRQRAAELRRKAASVRPGRGQIVLYTDRFAVRLNLGDGPPVPQSVPLGWENVARPGEVAITDWQGGDPAELVIPIVFKGGRVALPVQEGADRQARSVEQQIRRLERLAERPRGAEHPPPFRCRGPLPHRGHRWVLVAMEQTSAVWRGQHRVQAEFTITIRRFVPGDIVRPPAARRGRRSGPRIVRVRRGETLHRLAVRLGARTPRAIQQLVRRIRRANRLRAGQRVRPGQRLRVP